MAGAESRRVHRARILGAGPAVVAAKLLSYCAVGYNIPPEKVKSYYYVTSFFYDFMHTQTRYVSNSLTCNTYMTTG